MKGDRISKEKSDKNPLTSITSIAEHIPLDKIKTDGGTQPRAELNQAVVEEYAAEKKEGAVFPPATVFFDGQDYWLADGFHRFNADRLNGSETVEAIVKQGDRRDAILYSVGANASHGLRRTDADKRRAVTRLLEDTEWKKWSDRKISRQCGVAHTFVGKIRQELSGVELQIERTVQRGGTTYTQNTSRIGGSSGGSRSSTASKTISNDTDDTNIVTDSDNWFDELQYDEDNNCITLAEVTQGRYPELLGRHCQIKSVGNKTALLISPIDGKEYFYLVGEFILVQPTTAGKSTFDPHGKPDERTDEHYTPEYIWKLALECLKIEQFDLDPCSNSHHSPNVPATSIFTKEDDGLKQKWTAKTLWLNPPYSNTKNWIVRLIGEYKTGDVDEAIALIKGDFSTKWFQPLLEFPICLVDHRVKFENEDNNGGGAKFASAIVYLGINVESFYLTFDRRYSDDGIGIVVQAGVRGIHFGE